MPDEEQPWLPRGEEPWDETTARQVATRILGMQGDGALIVTRHADQRMVERELTIVDCLNVIRAGRVDGTLTDFHPQTRSWCYRIRTQRMWVEVAFDWPDSMRLVSCGRY